MIKTAVLMDTTSIQKYIFGSNKLKENLGASHIVKNIYKDLIEDGSTEVAFEGGGNVLLYFRSLDEAKSFVKNWTIKNLEKFPGLTVACAIEPEFDSEPSKFQNSLKKLFTLLAADKAQNIPMTRVRGHGITSECPLTGYSGEFWLQSQYISGVAFSKISHAESANRLLAQSYSDLLGQTFVFSNDFDQLGGSEGDNNHIAVVHIDGNGIGERFRACKDGEELKRLSISMENAVEKSFRALLQDLIANIGKLKELELAISDGKTILPVRPIIMGGDDITFVCDARLGVYCARVFMDSFSKQEVSDGKQISSCAGIAIVKVKYPFYRAYELAHELCSNAKKARKQNRDLQNSSWLDFHIAQSGITGSLSEIRQRHYFNQNKMQLTLRPFQLSSANAGEVTLKNMIQAVDGFSDWPESKIKELREVLYGNDSDVKNFLQQMKFRGRSLPAIEGVQARYHEEVFVNDQTPYLDFIELMEYYPEFAIYKESKHD